MKKAAISLVVLLPLGALAAPLSVGDLAGHWETALENCFIDDPAQGQRIDIDDSWEIPQLTYINHATEGGLCQLDKISDGEEDILWLGGRCSWAGGPLDTQAQFLAVMGNNGRLSLISEWLEGPPIPPFGAEVSLVPCNDFRAPGAVLDLMGY
jgi:hypothetical protein